MGQVGSMNDAVIFNLPEGDHGDLFTKHNCHADIKSLFNQRQRLFVLSMVNGTSQTHN
jgi:hypothetical protein